MIWSRFVQLAGQQVVSLCWDNKQIIHIFQCFTRIGHEQWYFRQNDSLNVNLWYGVLISLICSGFPKYVPHCPLSFELVRAVPRTRPQDGDSLFSTTLVVVGGTLLLFICWRYCWLLLLLLLFVVSGVVVGVDCCCWRCCYWCIVDDAYWRCCWCC